MKKLHELGLVHGDLHDENILIRTGGSRQGTAVLIDFNDTTHKAKKPSGQRNEMNRHSRVHNKDSNKLDEDYVESSENSSESEEDSISSTRISVSLMRKPVS